MNKYFNPTTPTFSGTGNLDPELDQEATKTRINIRMTPEQAERFALYLADHGLKESDAGRIAIERLLASKPKKTEREAAERKPGNPNFKRKES